MITIRTEQPQDIADIRKLNELAFGREDEANIVDRLRAGCPDLLSLVAREEGRLLGHILFSPAAIEGRSDTLRGMSLGPMAVLPERQNEGIGSSLVRAGISWLDSPSCPFILVLGHADFYPRFGFKRAHKRGIKCPWNGVPKEAFMVLVLDHEQMSGFSGSAQYRPEFVLE